MASEHTVTQVLLEWINSFALGKTIRSTEELSDGTIIWEILQDIDPQYFLDEIPYQAPTDRRSKLQNINYIQKALAKYIRHQSGGLPSGLDPEPNLQLFVENNSAKEANKLLKLLLIAAIRSPNNQSYVETIQTLTTPTQEGLKDIFEEAENGELEPPDEPNEAPEDPGIAMDRELKHEEEKGALVAKITRLAQVNSDLQKKNDDKDDILEAFKRQVDSYKSELALMEDRLTSLKSGKGDPGLNAKGLDVRSRQQEEVIAGLEEKLSSIQETNDSLRKDVGSLRLQLKGYQDLKDDYDELKTERDRLFRRANAGEKYRHKAQAVPDLEKEIQTLRDQNKVLQEKLKEADEQQKWTADQDRELEEYRIVLPRIEQECNDHYKMKKQLELDNHELQERVHGLEEQIRRLGRTDDVLEEETDQEYGGSPDSPTPTTGAMTPNLQGNLQQDLEALGVEDSILKSEVDDTRKEVDSLKEQQTSASSRIGHFSESFHETLHSTKAGSTQGDEYWRLYDQYTTTIQNLARVQDALDMSRQTLEDTRVDVSLADKERLDLINEVKESFKERLDHMYQQLCEARQQIADLKNENNASQVLARVACTERDDLREMLDERQAKVHKDDLNAVEEMKKLLTQFIAQETGEDSEATQKSVEELTKQILEQMEKNVERLAKRAEYIHQQNEHIKLLQDRITQFEKAAVEGNQKEDDGISKERELELQKQIEALTREIALLSSSWYDLQGKLHSTNNVPISRYRHGSAGLADAQKGWLARQRSAVAGR